MLDYIATAWTATLCSFNMKYKSVHWGELMQTVAVQHNPVSTSNTILDRNQFLTADDK